MLKHQETSCSSGRSDNPAVNINPAKAKQLSPEHHTAEDLQALEHPQQSRQSLMVEHFCSTATQVLEPAALDACIDGSLTHHVLIAGRGTQLLKLRTTS